MLVSPISIVAIVDGKSIPLQGEGVKFTHISGSSVQAEAHAKNNLIDAEIHLLGEYDGMLKYEVTLRGDKGAKLEGLDLVIPYRPEVAQFLHATGDGCRSNYSHAVPAGTGRVWDSTAVLNWVMPVQWLTYLWMGDHERGLCWWADSAEGWTLPRDRQTPVVEVIRTKDSVNAVFHLINRPSTVLWKDSTPRKIVFALEATPVRPRSSWARDIGYGDVKITSQKAPRISWIGATNWAFEGHSELDSTGDKYTYAYLRPVDALATTKLREHAALAKKEGKDLLIYTDMRARAAVGAEEKAYAWEWSPSLAEPDKATVENAPAYFTLAINSTKSRVDYDVWCFKNLLDLGVNCFYFDEIQDEGQINPSVGLGYQDEDGKWMPTMRLFNYRELWKRLYTVMQEHGQKEPIIVIHNTSTTYAGPMAFCTATFDFEEVNANPHERQLTKFGIDYLITEAMGHQYGFVSTTLGGSNFESWIPEGDAKSIYEAGRHWMGVHMILDMNPFLLVSKPVTEALKFLGEFGWNERDCVWIPYWRALEEKLFTYTPGPEQRCYVSMYRRGNHLLLIYLNDTDRDQIIHWQSTDKLPIQNPLVDAEDKNIKIEKSGSGYDVTVERFNYRAFITEVK